MRALKRLDTDTLRQGAPKGRRVLWVWDKAGIDFIYTKGRVFSRNGFWDIEKVFDEFKNKLGEKKSWASTPTAKCIQAQCLCLAHTLLLLFEKLVLDPSGIRNEAEEKRQGKRLGQVEAQLKEAGERLPVAIRQLLRCTQRSVKLIRWLRSCLFLATPCEANLGRLRELYRIS